MKFLTSESDLELIRSAGVGAKLAFARGSWSSPDWYWVTVKKISAKTFSCENPAGSWKAKELTFRCRSPWAGRPPEIMGYGCEDYGWSNGRIALPTTPDEIAEVEASYARRAAAKEANDENARRAAAKEANDENARRAAALAANAGVAFYKVGAIGDLEFWFTADAVEHNGRSCAVVLNVKRVERESWRDNTVKTVFSGALNYFENEAYYQEKDHNPGTMASCSPNVEAETREGLFAEAFTRIW